MSRVSRGSSLSRIRIQFKHASRFVFHRLVTYGVSAGLVNRQVNPKGIIRGNRPAFQFCQATAGWNSTSSVRAEEDNVWRPGEPQPSPEYPSRDFPGKPVQMRWMRHRNVQRLLGPQTGVDTSGINTATSHANPQLPAFGSVRACRTARHGRG